MVVDLISRVFNTRNQAHLAHWSESSGYHHEVLGEFYDSLVDILDKFIEAYQGNFGKITDIKLKNTDKEILKCIEEDIVWLTENRDEITEEICALENIIDELVALYLSTRFKLKQLK